MEIKYQKYQQNIEGNSSFRMWKWENCPSSLVIFYVGTFGGLAAPYGFQLSLTRRVAKWSCFRPPPPPHSLHEIAATGFSNIITSRIWIHDKRNIIDQIRNRILSVKLTFVIPFIINAKLNKYLYYILQKHFGWQMWAFESNCFSENPQDCEYHHCWHICKLCLQTWSKRGISTERTCFSCAETVCSRTGSQDWGQRY